MDLLKKDTTKAGLTPLLLTETLIYYFYLIIEVQKCYQRRIYITSYIGKYRDHDHEISNRDSRYRFQMSGNGAVGTVVRY